MTQTPSDNPGPIADHELLHPIGRGSAGVVWLARTLTGQFRALKIIEQSTAHAVAELGGLENYEPRSREHPALMSILQAGRHEGSLYYIMELADPLTGTNPLNPATYQPKTLASELAHHGAQTVAHCTAIGEAIARGLAHLHRHSLVHRDIKPSNILYINNQPVLGDPGLVMRTGEVIQPGGTLGYMPPEGVGQPAADIYALGKVLYETLTGRDRNAYPSLPAELLRGPDRHLLHRLNDIILKACSREPGARFTSANEMADALVRINRKRSVLAGALVGLAFVATAAWVLMPPKFLQQASPPTNSADSNTTAVYMHGSSFGAPALVILPDSNGTRRIAADVIFSGPFRTHVGLLLDVSSGEPAPHEERLRYHDAPLILARYLPAGFDGNPAPMVELLDKITVPPWNPIARATAPVIPRGEVFRMELVITPPTGKEENATVEVSINGKTLITHTWPQMPVGRAALLGGNGGFFFQNLSPDFRNAKLQFGGEGRWKWVSKINETPDFP